jgi:exosome complex exonuclease DIS3/RRP44
MQNPTDVGIYSLKEANALVEEWMLLANITVSKKILRHFPTLCVLRRHQPPSAEQFAPLLSAARARGVHLDISSSKELADSLDLAVLEDDPYFNKLLRIVSTRCMMPAQYFCSGELAKEQWHHYGLAAPVYTHFTSPIRRYADVIVHRLLAAAIGVQSLPAENADRSKQHELCANMNRRHKAAQHASRASVSLHTLVYFKNRASTEDAYVLSVASEEIIVLVPKFGIEGSVSLEQVSQQLKVDIKHYPEIHKIEFVSPKSSEGVHTIQVFDKVRVSINVEENPTTNVRVLKMHLILERLETKGTSPATEIHEKLMNQRSTTSSQKNGKTGGKRKNVSIPQKKKGEKKKKT